MSRDSSSNFHLPQGFNKLIRLLGLYTRTMTYETFKLSVLHQCAGNVHFPDILASMEYAASRYADESAEQMLSIAYNHYCAGHGLDYRQIVVLSLLPEDLWVKSEPFPKFYPAAQKPASVAVKVKKLPLDGCDLLKVIHSEVTGVPDRLQGVFLIVPKEVKAAMPDREDLVYPDYDNAVTINDRTIASGLRL